MLSMATILHKFYFCLYKNYINNVDQFFLPNQKNFDPSSKDIHPSISLHSITEAPEIPEMSNTRPSLPSPQKKILKPDWIMKWQLNTNMPIPHSAKKLQGIKKLADPMQIATNPSCFFSVNMCMYKCKKAQKQWQWTACGCVCVCCVSLNCSPKASSVAGSRLGTPSSCQLGS